MNDQIIEQTCACTAKYTGEAWKKQCYDCWKRDHASSNGMGKATTLEPNTMAMAQQDWDKEFIFCDRCELKMRISDENLGWTAGYYLLIGGWHKYRKAEEELRICDNCMWVDPKYIEQYGQQTLHQHKPEEYEREV